MPLNKKTETNKSTYYYVLFVTKYYSIKLILCNIIWIYMKGMYLF